MRNRHIIAIIIVFLMAIVSCAANNGAVKTPQDYYDNALSFWYNTEQNFKLIYNGATDQEKAEMIPFAKALRDSKRVLDLWKMNLEGGQPTADSIERWKVLKNELIIMILNNYKKEE